MIKPPNASGEVVSSYVTCNKLLIFKNNIFKDDRSVSGRPKNKPKTNNN